MDRLEFLVEEPSAAEILKAILPQILPTSWVINENYFIRVHEGKRDLQKSIPHKIRAFSNWSQSVGVIILHDQDDNDCKKLKSDLVDLCSTYTKNKKPPFLIRIACHELESWYFGDMNALSAVFPNFKPNNYKNKNKYKKPDDNCLHPKKELKRILGDYSQIQVAKEMGAKMDINKNSSESFNQFVTGVQRFVTSN